jgi:hypothetical protein
MGTRRAGAKTSRQALCELPAAPSTVESATLATVVDDAVPSGGIPHG